MFARYKISIDTVEELLGNKYWLLESVVATTESKVNEQVAKLFSPKDGIISGDVLQDDFFPTDSAKPYRVFISHSGKDREIVEKFAGILEERYKVKCFVDSMVWKGIGELQRRIDNNLPKTKNGALQYKDILQTSAHVHSMLSIALFKMIDQCECCIFVGSKNSLNLNLHSVQDETLSSWIYQEIYYMNHAKPTEPDWLARVRLYSANEAQNILESVAAKVSHGIDLSNFIPLCTEHFPCKYFANGDEFLRELYYETMITNGKIIDKYGRIL